MILLNELILEVRLCLVGESLFIGLDSADVVNDFEGGNGLLGTFGEGLLRQLHQRIIIKCGYRLFLKIVIIYKIDKIIIIIKIIFWFS